MNTEQKQQLRTLLISSFGARATQWAIETIGTKNGTEFFNIAVVVNEDEITREAARALCNFEETVYDVSGQKLCAAETQIYPRQDQDCVKVFMGDTPLEPLR